jgi:hypothetical protein
MHQYGKLFSRCNYELFFLEKPPRDVIEAGVVVEMSPQKTMIHKFNGEVLDEQLTEVPLEKFVLLPLVIEHDRSAIEVLTHQDIAG